MVRRQKSAEKSANTSTRQVQENKTTNEEPSKADDREDRKITAARQRQAWRKSDDRRRMRRQVPFMLGLTPIPVAIGAITLWIVSDPSVRAEKAFIGGTIAGIAWIYIAAYWLLIYRVQWGQAYKDQLLLGQAEDELQQAEQEVGAGATDLSSLWAATQKRLDLYHKITTTQAERSFMCAQIAASVGFAVLIASAIIAGLARTPTASIVAGATGISGGGLAAYIGATYMKTQDRASDQLRIYFTQPVEFLKFLAAERLAKSLHDGNRQSAIQGMISAMTESVAPSSVSAKTDTDTPSDSGKQGKRKRSRLWRPTKGGGQ